MILCMSLPTINKENNCYYYFLEFFPNLYIPPWSRKSFKFIVLRLLANTFVSQKLESVHFYSCPQAKFSPRFSSQTAFSDDIFFLSRKVGDRIMELKNLPKLKLQGYWSQVLIYSTIFATFTFLVCVLLCNNLASSMLKCEVSLT